MLADDETLGQSWFETPTALSHDLIGKAARHLGIGAACGSLKDLALHIEEDIAIIHQGMMEACCFMFPSGWAPEEKAGMDFAALHAPVADGDRLRAAGPRIAELMCGEHSYHRTVWGLAASDRFSAHPRYLNTVQSPKSPADIWFRYEHQITVPLEAGVNSLFLVDVQLVPYSGLSEDIRARIRQSIATMTPSVIAYKGLAPFLVILGES